MATRTSWNPRLERAPEYLDDDAYAYDPAYDDLLDQGFDDYGRLTRRGANRAPNPGYDDVPGRGDLRRAVDSLARQVEAVAGQSGRAHPPAPVAAGGPSRRSHATLNALDRLEARLDALHEEAQRRGPENSGHDDLNRRFANHAEAERAKVEAMMDRHFAALDQRIAALHDLARGKNVDAIRDDLVNIGDRIEGLASSGKTVSGSIEQVHEQLGELRHRLESEGWTGANAVSAMQDRLDLITDKLAQLELTPSALSAVERGYSHILERVSRIEQLAGQNVVADDLWERLDGFRDQIGALHNNDTLSSVERRLAALSDNVDALSANRGHDPAIDRLEMKLADMARTIGIIRDRRDMHSGAIEARLADITARIDKMAKDRGRIDLTPVERQISSLASRFDQINADQQDIDLSGMEKQLATLGGRIEEMLARPAPDDRPAFDSIETRLSELQSRLEDVFKAAERSGATAESAAGLGNVEKHLTDLHGRLDDLTLATGADPADLTPIATRLDAIDGRLNGLADGVGSSAMPLELAILSDKLNLIDEQLRAIAPSSPDLPLLLERLAGIEKRMEAADRVEVDFTPLAGQIQALERLLQDRSPEEIDLQPVSGRLDTIEARLQELVSNFPAETRSVADRLDAIDRRFEQFPQAGVADLSPLNDQLVAIDRQLRELSIPESGAIDWSPITARLDAMDLRLTGHQPGEALDLGGLQEALAEIGERLDGLANGGAALAPAGTGTAGEDIQVVSERLQAIEQRLEHIQAGGSPDNENLMPLLETFEAALSKLSTSDVISALAEKVSGLHAALDGAGEATALDEMADLRNDITYLRRELRSMPMMAESEEGSAGLGSILTEIKERLDRVAEEQPVTFRDLEDQIGRVVRTIETGGAGEGSLAQIESSLASIEGHLAAGNPGAVQELLAGLPDGAQGDGAAIAALAASIEGSINELRHATEVSDEDTRRTLDALNSTMEAIVNRMAYLESAAVPQHAGMMQASGVDEEYYEPQPDTEAADMEEIPEISIGAEQAADQIPMDAEEYESEPVAEAAEIAYAAESDAAEDAQDAGGQAEMLSAEQQFEPVEQGEIEAPEEFEPPADVVEEPQHFEAPVDHAGGVDESPAGAEGSEMQPAENQPEEVDDDSQSIIGRLTSSQILKRATGGRADSFTPGAEDEAGEVDERPLEPGTDAPMDSSLVDAPSSDTAMMSGDGEAPENRTRQGAGLGDLAAASGLGFETDEESEQGSQFLSAARKAARAAVLEAANVEPAPEPAKPAARRPQKKSRVGLILAVALVLAVAFAGYKFWRGELDLNSLSLESLGIGGFSLSENASDHGANPARMAQASGPQSGTLAESAGDPSAMAPSAAGVDATGLEQVAPNAEIAFGAPESSSAMTMQVGDAISSVIAAVTEKFAQPGELAAAGRGAKDDRLGSADTIESTASVSESTANLMASGSADKADLAERTEALIAGAVAGAKSRTAALPKRTAATPHVLPMSIGSAGLRHAALAGIPEAQFEIASRFADGSGVRTDLKTAALWYEKAAREGLVPAQFRLGSLFEKGRGVPLDRIRAARLYAAAAEAGNAKAMHNLAVLYAEGGAGEPDLAKSAEWFRRAAEHGVRDSQFNAGILYARGLGVQRDYSEAYKWFTIAAKSGDEQAARRRDKIAASMTQDEISRALATADIFQPIPLVPEANAIHVPKGGWATAAAKAGPSGAELISRIQALLAERGFEPGPADGVMGRRTAGAIEAFQMEAGLPITGKPDLTVLSALKTIAD